MDECPADGDFSVCRNVVVGGGNYTYILGSSDSKVGNDSRSKTPRMEVAGMGKDSASIILNFEIKLRKMETNAIPYSVVNRYLLGSLGDDTDVGLFNLKEMMTYGRNDSPKTYADAYAALSQIPRTVNMSSLYNVVDGMP